jgi:ribonuclease T2
MLNLSFAFIVAVAVFWKVKASSDTVYVLAYSWQPQFCWGTTYPGCTNPEDFWKTHFTMHGLWPQYTTTGYPSSCTTEKFDPAVTDAIGMDTMIQYWPNVKEAEGSANYDDFWDHEWSKHGTCSGLTQTNYFQDSLNLIEKLGTPSVISSNVGKNVSASSVRDAFGGPKRASLQCSSSVYINGMHYITILSR